MASSLLQKQEYMHLIAKLNEILLPERKEFTVFSYLNATFEYVLFIMICCFCGVLLFLFIECECLFLQIMKILLGLSIILACYKITTSSQSSILELLIHQKIA